MNKERNYKNAIIAVLFVCVIMLSVAFAAFSTSLQVSGTTKVLSSAKSWNVAFESAKATKGGYATSTASEVTGEKTVTITFDCELSSDLDSCTLTGSIKNYGSINALYKSYKLTLGSENKTEPTISNDDIQVTYTKPADWNEGSTVLHTNDNGQFTLKIAALPGITFPQGEAPDKQYSVSLTFEFEQAAPTE